MIKWLVDRTLNFSIGHLPLQKQFLLVFVTWFPGSSTFSPRWWKFSTRVKMAFMRELSKFDIAAARSQSGSVHALRYSNLFDTFNKLDWNSKLGSTQNEGSAFCLRCFFSRFSESFLRFSDLKSFQHETILVWTEKFVSSETFSHSSASKDAFILMKKNSNLT